MSMRKQMKSSPGRSAWLPVAAVLALLAGACKSDETTAPATEGNIQVTVSTTGSELDPDGYTVSVAGRSDQAVGSNGSVTFQSVTEGATQVTLSGIASNCSVAGSNPMTVSVVAEQTVEATFNVVCVATTGSVVVSTTTTGSDIDPDGYTLTIDGGSAQAIGTNQTLTLNDVPIGDRAIELTGVAGNCTVTPDNPRTVTVPQGSAVQTDFEISCAAIVGNVEVITSTTGEDRDPDGFTLAVESAAPAPIGVVDTVQVADVLFGDRQVELQGLAANCSVVNGTNPRTVTVPENGLVSTTFVVDCEPLEGTISLTATTTGDDQDPDGYTVSIDGGGGQAVPVNGTIVLSNVPAGDRSLQLSGIAPNCSVTTPNPLVVTVPFADTVAAAFDLTCSAVVGDVDITTTTSGSQVDPDGYMVTVEGQSPQAIGNNAMITVTGVSAGDRTVTLSDVAGNCSVAEPNPQTVTVPDGGSVNATFTVTCAAVISDQIVFDTNRDSNNGEIYIMNPDGTGPVSLTGTPTGANEGEPHVSFDGTKIAYVSDSDGAIWVMDADGSNQTSTGVAGDQPAWSPDGTQIVFRRSGTEIWRMNADGSGLLQLTNDGGLPDWSPDGTTIAFSSDRFGDSEIFTMSSVDGDASGVTRLTTIAGDDFGPAWSPDGSQIAFVSQQDGDAEIYVMTSAGSGQTALTSNTSFDAAPTWSPDGSQIAFGSNVSGNFEVYTVPSTGGTPTNRTNNAASDFEASWR